MRVWLPLLALATWPVAAEVEVTSLARDFEAVDETDDVRCTLFASFEETGVAVGMELEPGDLLASVSGATDLELTCPNGSLLRFSGSFRVLINPPEEGGDCAVNFLSGTLDVLTDQPTEVNAGGVVLGSEGTQFSVELSRGADGGEQTCNVYDGRVRWRARGVEQRWLDGGRRLNWDRDDFSEAEVPEAQLSRVAGRQARFDAIMALRRGAAEDPRAAAERLAELHHAVLAEPGDADRRVALAKAQLDYRISDQATYHLGRAGVRTEEQMRSHQIDVDKLKGWQGTRGTGALGQTGLSGGAPVERPARDPYALIERQRYLEALEVLEPRAEAGTADSRDLCAMARSYRALEGAYAGRASGLAKRAVLAHAQDGKTPAREFDVCRRLAR